MIPVWFCRRRLHRPRLMVIPIQQRKEGVLDKAQEVTGTFGKQYAVRK